MSSSHIIDIQNLSLNVENHRAVAYSNIAGYALLLYDLFLTINDEIEYIWPTPWNLGKVLFYATKYSPILDGALILYSYLAPAGTAPRTCGLLYKVSGGMIMVGIYVAELILVLRTWAVWGKISKVGILLFCATLLAAFPIGYFSYVALAPITFAPSPLADYACWEVIHLNKTIFVDFVLIVIYETIILILTTYMCLQHFRRRKSHLIAILYRDGVLYYIILIGISTINVVILALRPTPRLSFVFIQRVFHSIFTAQILVNLRKAAFANYTNTYTLADPNNTDRIRTIFTSVILGVDTWFQNPGFATEMTDSSDEYGSSGTS